MTEQNICLESTGLEVVSHILVRRQTGYGTCCLLACFLVPLKSHHGQKTLFVTRVIELPILGGSNLMQIYGHFERFALSKSCIVWGVVSYIISWPLVKWNTQWYQMRFSNLKPRGRCNLGDILPHLFWEVGHCFDARWCAAILLLKNPRWFHPPTFPPKSSELLFSCSFCCCVCFLSTEPWHFPWNFPGFYFSNIMKWSSEELHLTEIICGKPESRSKNPQWFTQETFGSSWKFFHFSRLGNSTSWRDSKPCSVGFH